MRKSRVAQHDPGLRALADVGECRPERQQPVDLGLLVVRPEVEMKSVLQTLTLNEVARTGNDRHSLRVPGPMRTFSRRTMLAAPIAGAGALLLGRQAGDEPTGLDVTPDSPYLLAKESPTYDQSFATFSTRHSVAAGDELDIRVRTKGAVDIEIVRIGWTGGPRIGTTAARYEGVRPASFEPNAPPLDWPSAARLAVPSDWKSGLYAAVVIDRSDRRRRRFAPFVVRAAARPARIVVSIPFTTYHAYNAWGGASLYPFNSPNGVAASLSIARPFDVFDGAGFMFYGDWQLARWLDRERDDVSYITSFDLHRDPHVFDGAALFVTAFHDEYWSTPMRDTLERFIGSGGNAAFLAANSVFWRVRLDEATMTCHKAASVADDPDPDITALWRGPLIDRPEHMLLGSQYQDYQFLYGTSFDWTVAAADHWLYAGTGLTNGSTLPGLVGYEWDRAPSPVPAGTIVLAHTDFEKADGDRRGHDATERVHPGGGTVVNVGTTYWPRFLVGDKAFRTDAAVEQMTRNLLDRLGGVRSS